MKPRTFKVFLYFIVFYLTIPCYLNFVQSVFVNNSLRKLNHNQLKANYSQTISTKKNSTNLIKPKHDVKKINFKGEKNYHCQLDYTKNDYYIFDSHHILNKTKDSQPNKCKICIDVVNMLEYGLHMGIKIINDLITLVNDLCEDIGGPIVKKECDFILNNITKIINMLEKGVKPEIICQKLNECPIN